MECTLKKFTFLPEIPPLEEFHVALRFTQLGFSPLLEVEEIIFSSVQFLSKTNNQIELKKKTEISSNQPVSVWFGFLGQKPVQTGLARFFQFGSVFPGLARFFSVWVRFSSVFLVSGL